MPTAADAHSKRHENQPKKTASSSTLAPRKSITTTRTRIAPQPTDRKTRSSSSSTRPAVSAPAAPAPRAQFLPAPAPAPASADTQPPASDSSEIDSGDVSPSDLPDSSPERTAAPLPSTTFPAVRIPTITISPAPPALPQPPTPAPNAVHIASHLSFAPAPARPSSSSRIPAPAAASPAPPTPANPTPAPAKSPTPLPNAMPTGNAATRTGPGAMPNPRSHQAAIFSGKSRDFKDFIQEYDDLATSCGLNEKEKSETILRYIPTEIRDLWRAQTGFGNVTQWDDFKKALEKLYPDTAKESRYTKRALSDFVQRSATIRMEDEEDVLTYYREFLTLATPLSNAKRITDEDRDQEFFFGFHPEDRILLMNRLAASNPTHDTTKPYSYLVVAEAARSLFSNAHFYPVHLQRSSDLPIDWYRRREGQGVEEKSRKEWMTGREHRSWEREAEELRGREGQRTERQERVPDYETRRVRIAEPPVQEPPKRANDDRDIEDLMSKLHGLSITEPSYAVLYGQCAHRFPNVANFLPKPVFTQAAPNVSTYQYTAPHTAAPAVAVPPPAPFAPTPATSFFRQPAQRPAGCSFCNQAGHRIRECASAREYVQTGRATLWNDRLYLPNNAPVPNDGTGRGIKAGIDAWLTANTTLQPLALAPEMQRPPPPHAAAPFQRESPLHQTLCYEAVMQQSVVAPVESAFIEEPAVVDEDAEMPAEVDDEDGESPEEEDGWAKDELWEMLEVFATEKKKKETRTSKLPETAPPKPAEKTKPRAPKTDVPTAPKPVPQFRYQSTAEDQKLIDELLAWLLDGRLSNTTPAHILAASPTIRKEMVERLRTRRVEAAGFEATAEDEANDEPTEVFSMLKTREAMRSLPLREIDLLVNNSSREVGVLDQGSQIIVMHVDLAKRANLPINYDKQIEMEGTNGATSWMLGCAENVPMRIGPITFELHAYIVESAPFQLLLGRPFFNLLLCRIEDQPSGEVNMIIRDPANFSHKISVPSRARQPVRVNLLETFGYQSHEPPPIIVGLADDSPPSRVSHSTLPSSMPRDDTLSDPDFFPGDLDLVRNARSAAIKTDLSRKSKPCYLGPLIVVRRSQNGSYRLAELDGAVSKLRFAAFRLVLYYARSRTSIPVTRVVGREGFAAVVRKDTEDTTGVEEEELEEEEDQPGESFAFKSPSQV